MLRVLAIDDTRTVHAFLRSCLGSLPEATLTSVMDGQEAVDLLQRPDAPRPDLIFLDWEMPRLDGPSTYARIRELGITTPVIMLTTKSAPADILRMLDAGVAEYVMKPFTSDILLAKVASVLGVPTAARGP